MFRDVHNLLKANPVKWTECELETSLGKLTSATFQTSHYGGGCPAAALPHGSPELCTHNHKFTRWIQKYGVHACGRRTRCAEKTLIRPCEIVTIPGSRCQMALKLEGHDGWQRVEGEGHAVGEGRAESQMWRVTWSNRGDLRLIGFHIGSMVSGPQNARYGGEISLRL